MYILGSSARSCLIVAAIALDSFSAHATLPPDAVLESPRTWVAGGSYSGASPMQAAITSWASTVAPQFQPVTPLECHRIGLPSTVTYACTGMTNGFGLVTASPQANCTLIHETGTPISVAHCGRYVNVLLPHPYENLGNCPDCPRAGNAGPNQPATGNPINAGTGNKFQSETDYTSPDDGAALRARLQLRPGRGVALDGRQLAPQLGSGHSAGCHERDVCHPW